MKHLVLSLSLLLFSVVSQMAAQITTVATLGTGTCNTSPSDAYYCVAIPVTGIGTPGWTWAAFYVTPRSGAPTAGFISIVDDHTSPAKYFTVTPEDSLVSPSNSSGASVYLVGQDGWIMQGTISMVAIYNRWHQRIGTRPAFNGGTASITR